MIKEAKRVQANAVIGIETTVKPFKGVHEMFMTGTAARCPKLPPEHARGSRLQRFDGRGTVESHEHGLCPA